MDQALGTTWTDAELSDYADELTAYLSEHLTVTGTDGTVWTETFSGATVKEVEGITSFSVDVTLDSAGADPAAFTLDYDAIIEAIPSHEAVVVLTDATGEVSTAVAITTDQSTLALGEAAASDLPTGLLDMVGYGFHHVLEGADHLLFLFTLLLAAPLLVQAGRWVRPGSRRQRAPGRWDRSANSSHEAPSVLAC